MGEYYILMYENGKMRPVETPRNGGGEIKENGRGDESSMIYYKNFYKCHNVPPGNNNKKSQTSGSVMGRQYIST
jgi:hypothetical protein